MLKAMDKVSVWQCEDPSPKKRVATGLRRGLQLRHHISSRSRAASNTDAASCKVQQSDYEVVRSALENIDAKLHEIAHEYRFRQLAATWKLETKFLSNVTVKAMHPAYQKIIGMGKSAVPFILKDLQENGPRHWFWALTSITDANPIPEKNPGNMTAMTEAWLQWGREEGYLRD